MKFFSVYFFIGVIFLLISCKTTLPVKPSEHYDPYDIKPRTSIMNIPIRLHKLELQNAINTELGETLFEEDDKEEGLTIIAKKGGEITIELNNEYLSYQVPLNLLVKKSTFLGNAEAEGRLIIDLITNYQIEPDWNFTTQTEVENHNWVEKPVLKLGFANLPIQFIADIVLDKMKTTLTAAIDKNISGSFNLQSQIDTAWTGLQDPILLSEEYKTWLQFNPQKLELTPFHTNENIVSATVVISALPEIILGNKPIQLLKTDLPNFQLTEKVGDDFIFELGTAISFDETERISKENMIGETYSAGKRSVTVKDIELYGKGNKLVVNTLLEGDYDGNLYFIGEPKYNSRKNKIELEKVDFDFTSKRFLLKSASWLFKGSLKRAIQDNLDFYLEENLEDIKKMIQKQLNDYQLSKGIFLNGNLTELNISHVYVAPDGIHVRVGLTGKLNVDVKGF